MLRKNMSFSTVGILIVSVLVFLTGCEIGNSADSRFDEETENLVIPETTLTPVPEEMRFDSDKRILEIS